ncbi:hypothetical protein K502DRAFT_368598 [Neoconidiobolus thromboides FSU 785]|nr:hypothetical protein K502DRAFT_368598 [Neoconidiobolus thromboides FSU 785]
MGKEEMAKVEESSLSLLTGYSQQEEIIWEGTTWPLLCCSPLTMNSIQWKITNKKIEKIHGFMGSKNDVIDLRRVTDIAYFRSCTQMCSGRGSIVIHSSTSMEPVVVISSWGLKEVYRKLKEAWLSSNANQFIMAT